MLAGDLKLLSRSCFFLWKVLFHHSKVSSVLINLQKFQAFKLYFANYIYTVYLFGTAILKWLLDTSRWPIYPSCQGCGHMLTVYQPEQYKKSCFYHLKVNLCVTAREKSHGSVVGFFIGETWSQHIYIMLFFLYINRLFCYSLKLLPTLPSF